MCDNGGERGGVALELVITLTAVLTDSSSLGRLPSVRPSRLMALPCLLPRTSVHFKFLCQCATCASLLEEEALFKWPASLPPARAPASPSFHLLRPPVTTVASHEHKWWKFPKESSVSPVTKRPAAMPLIQQCPRLEGQGRKEGEKKASIHSRLLPPALSLPPSLTPSVAPDATCCIHSIASQA